LLHGGITYILMSEVAFDPLGLFLDASQSADCGSCQSELDSGRSDLCSALFQVHVEQLIWIQLWRIAGEIEDLDLVLIFREPFLHCLDSGAP